MNSNLRAFQMEPIPDVDIDRRKHVRIRETLPVFVTGRDQSGHSFSFHTATWDIGVGGLRSIAPQTMCVGEKLSLRIRFAQAGGLSQTAPEAVAKCVVLRAESRPDGACVFAVAFLKKHVL